ncbi:hypothetical protein Tco_1023347 [Tanacetum coccineum]
MEESSKRAEIAQESSSKRAGDELEQKNAKKQKADGSSKRYSAFIQMLKSFDREDLETLWKLEDSSVEESYLGDKGRIVKIKRLLDDLKVTAAKLMLLVQKLLLLVLKVNVAGMKVATAGRVYANREKIKDLSEKEYRLIGDQDYLRDKQQLTKTKSVDGLLSFRSLCDSMGCFKLVFIDDVVLEMITKLICFQEGPCDVVVVDVDVRCVAMYFSTRDDTMLSIFDVVNGCDMVDDVGGVGVTIGFVGLILTMRFPVFFFGCSLLFEGGGGTAVMVGGDSGR